MLNFLCGNPTLDAIDHTQWEFDEMKRETQQLLREALESMKNELEVRCGCYGLIHNLTGFEASCWLKVGPLALKSVKQSRLTQFMTKLIS